MDRAGAVQVATKQSAVTSDEVCTTQVAAQMLGISVSLVQQLVETGVLDAWKTQGGHRRIPLKAVLDYKNKLAGSMGREAGGRATILVIEDNAIQRALYQRQFAAWDLPADFIFCENGYQALLQIASVTRAQVAGVRGVNVDGVMRTLTLRGLIAEVDPDEATGAHRYVTTELLLEQLGIDSLDRLPDLAPLLPEVDSIEDSW